MGEFKTLMSCLDIVLSVKMPFSKLHDTTGEGKLLRRKTDQSRTLQKV